MKATIGDKIRAVLEKYPEVKRRRAQLNAIGYLFKRDKKVTAQWHSYEQLVSLDTNLTALICMKSLSEYNCEPLVTRLVNGDTLQGPMLVFNDNKFEVVP